MYAKGKTEGLKWKGSRASAGVHSTMSGLSVRGADTYDL